LPRTGHALLIFVRLRYPGRPNKSGHDGHIP
jgi:hypothetical protein